MRLSRPAILALAAAGLALLMILLNPGAERHRDALREATQERSALESALGLGHVRAFLAEYHSLGLVSYTTVGGKTASIGVLGLVMVRDE
jgi:hypothetical protein